MLSIKSCQSQIISHIGLMIILGLGDFGDLSRKMLNLRQRPIADIGTYSTYI